MTHLNIQQGLNIEVVTTLIIKKLYEAALSVPEPLEGELDAAYMSGNLLVDKSYRALVEYLTNRFDDLHINVTDSYYIPFEDSAVLNVLLANNIGSDGIGVTEAEAANATFTSSTFLDNTDITSFDEFKYFTKANTNPPNALFKGCTSLTSIDLSNVTAFSSEEFRNTRIPNVTIPSSATTISSNCFSWNTSLTSVTAPDVQVIETRAFDLCTSLTTFSGFSNVTTIYERAFYVCPLTGILNIPNLTVLELLAFAGNKLSGIECLGTISSIPQSCFGAAIRTNNLQYVYLPYECTSLGNTAFRTQTALATIKQYDKTISAYQEGETKTFLPDLSKITSFGNACFRECFALPLTGADLVNATNIGSECFYLSGLSGALTLSHLISLGNNAFLNCTGITSLDFTGSTFTAVGASTFRGCSNLTKLVLPTTVTTVGNEWVVDVPRLITVEGTDNIANYGNANHYFRNPIITNPLKTGFVSDRSSLFMVHGNSANTGMSLHSLYEPLRKNTPVGSFILASNNKMSLFWGSPSNSANANIGLYYLKDIETFGYMTFYGTTIDNLVINNVTPPTLTTTENSTLMGYTMYQNWGNVIFGPNSVIGTLWVPDSAVTTYQADPLYSGLTIKGINTKTNGVDYDLPRYATYADWKTAEAAAVAQGGHAPQGLIEAWM